MKVIWSARALMRLLQIHDFVAGDDSAAAARLSERLFARAEALSSLPFRGRPVPEAPGRSLRELIEGSYRIIYRVDAGTVQIVTVFEGHRRFPREDVW